MQQLTSRKLEFSLSPTAGQLLNQEQIAAAKFLDLSQFRGRVIGGTQKALREVDELCAEFGRNGRLTLVELQAGLARWRDGRFLEWLLANRRANLNRLCTDSSLGGISMGSLKLGVEQYCTEVLQRLAGTLPDRLADRGASGAELATGLVSGVREGGEGAAVDRDKGDV